jgi:diguanylate cyclase (GGDEF)-like protein
MILQNASHTMFLLAQFALGAMVMYVSSALLTAVARSKVELAMMNIECREMSLRDSLTGLYNNRQFMFEQIRHYSALAKRQNELIVILFADLDGLKKINDNFSHLAGDSAIVATAKRIKQAMRETDFVFRFGGDEFLIITAVKNTTETEVEAEIEKITHRIIESVSSKAINYGQEKIPLAISIGSHILNIENAIERELLIVDKKMYAIKNR